MLRLPECRATNRHCDRNRLIVPVVGSSPTLVQLHARAMFSLISDTPASWKLASLFVAVSGDSPDEDPAIAGKSANEVLCLWCESSATIH